MIRSKHLKVDWEVDSANLTCGHNLSTLRTLTVCLCLKAEVGGLCLMAPTVRVCRICHRRTMQNSSPVLFVGTA